MSHVNAIGGSTHLANKLKLLYANRTDTQYGFTY